MTALPNGWRFVKGGKKPCEHCHGTGQVDTSARMVAPSGHSVEVINFNAAVAREYAELWAPEKCSPSKRAELYGDQPHPGGNDGNQDPREGEAQAQDQAAT